MSLRGLLRTFFFVLEMPNAFLIISKRLSILTLSLKPDLGLNMITGKTIVMINLTSSSVTQSVGY